MSEESATSPEEYELTRKEKAELRKLENERYLPPVKADRCSYLCSKRRYLSIKKSNQPLTESKKLQIQCSALVDGDTCEECLSINKQVVDQGTLFKGVSGTQYEIPPFHSGCRCEIVPWRESWRPILEQLEADLKKQKQEN
jgi:hypothetical protein